MQASVQRQGWAPVLAQTRLLLYKNWLFSKRNLPSLFWQVCSAACFVLVLAVLGNVLIHADQRELDLLEPRDISAIPRCQVWGDVKSCITVSYAPSGVPEVEQLVAELAQRNNLTFWHGQDGFDVFSCDRAKGIDYCDLERKAGKVDVPDVLGWPSDMDLRLASVLMPNVTWGGVVINANQLVHHRHLHYTIHYNGTCPNPGGGNHLWLDCTSSVQTPLYLTYHLDRVFLDQMAATSKLCADTGRGCSVEMSVQRENLLMDTTKMKRNERLEDAIVGAAGLLFFFTGLTVNYLMLLHQLVGEKENGLRQGMWVMGLLDSSHWFSWIITSIITTVLSLALMLGAGYALGIAYIKYATPAVHIAVFGSFCLAMMSFTMFLSVFFKQSRDCVSSGLVIIVVGVVFFVLFEAQVLYLLWPKETEPNAHTSWLLPVFSAFPWFHLAKSSNDVFSELLYRETYNMHAAEPISLVFTWNDLFLPSVSQFDTMVPAPIYAVYYQLMLCGAYLLATWYADAVLDDSHGAPRPWTFFLSRAYWADVLLGKHALSRRTGGDGINNNNNSAGFGDDDDDDDDDAPGGGHEASSLLTADLESDVLIDELYVRYRAAPSLSDLLSRRDTSGRDVKAVNGLNLRVRKGNLLCLLGQNGAGKSTTINVLLGVRQPESGRVRILGFEQDQRSLVHPLIGLCPQGDMLWLQLTAYEHLKIFSRLKNVPADRIDKEIDAILNDVGLLHVKHDPVRTFSGGMKRRLSVALACIADPKLIIMDEPTTGMDPISRREVWDLLRRLKTNRTFVFTTHSMEEAEYVGDTIAIMAHGRLHCQGTSMELKAQYGAGYLLHAVVDPHRANMFHKAIRRYLPDAKRVATTTTTASYSIPLASASRLPEFFDELDSMTHRDHGSDDGPAAREPSSVIVQDWSIAHSTLEEVFLAVLHEANGDASPHAGSARSSSPAGLMRSARSSTPGSVRRASPAPAASAAAAAAEPLPADASAAAVPEHPQDAL